MRFMLSIVVMLGFAMKLPAQPEESARNALANSIKSIGNEASILKLRVAQVKYTSVLSFPVKGDADISVEDTYQLPKQFKKVTKGKLNGKAFELTWAVIDGGDKWWQREGDGPAKFMDDTREIETLYRPFLVLEQLVFAVRDKNANLKSMGETKIGKKTHVVVRMTPPTGTATDLFFDKETWLLAKTEHLRKLPGAEKETLQETYLKEYKMVAGVTLFHRQNSYNDGKRVGEVTITEVKTFEKLDDKLFDAP